MHFEYFCPAALNTFLVPRKGEIKLGERIQLVAHHDELTKNTAKYVVIGIPEDLGVKANFGIGGARTLWDDFLHRFLNMQSNAYLTGEELILLGAFHFEDLNYNQPQNIDTLRDLVNLIDSRVSHMLQIVFAAGKIPILIGGGHNNSYPILKAASKAYNRRINCVNLDAHADFRPLEGRHSGNGFSYAKAHGFLARYFMLGLHENYNSAPMLETIEVDPELAYLSFESISIRQHHTFNEALVVAKRFTSDGYTGLELDLDCIENILSSAITPSGFSSTQARQFVHALHDSNTIYLHICEGAKRLDTTLSANTTGKLVAYLVSDFIKSPLGF